MIGLWASVSQRQRDGSLVQVDRGGHPTINPFVNPNNVKNTYNLGQPVDDVAKYLGPWSKFLEEHGGYSPRRRRRRPASCCRTSFATTAASRSGTRTGAP
jgi:hypothetical protein